MQLETNVRAEISDLIGATDASETHGGMCRLRVSFLQKLTFMTDAKAQVDMCFYTPPTLQTPRTEPNQVWMP